jgi:chromate transporter
MTSVLRDDVAVRRIPFGEALRFWLKLGFISFGGPAGQIAIMHRELVEERRWISEERFLHALNYCMLLPGPEAMQLATYIGWLLHRTQGGLVAGGLFVLPSIVILLALSYVYTTYGDVPIVMAVLSGFKPIVIAIVVEAVSRIGRRALKRRAHIVIAAAAFIGIYALQVPFPLIVLSAGIVGFAGARVWPDVFVPKASKPATPASARARLAVELLPIAIDDHAPPPPHARPSRPRAVRVIACGLLLWVAPLIALGAWRGWDSLHVHLYGFFSQAALVTFGGAYAVLAYVTQAAVAEYGWLTHAQAVDGLALAETTPGPLIMVLQFVGYVAAWNHPEQMTPPESALVGALVTTYVTFLPCFIFIFLGAPYIEVLRGNKNLTGALTGVTAAVVGVVLNLAVVFGAAVLLPDGFGASIDWTAAVMTLIALIVIFKLQVNIVWVVLAGGIAGAFLHYVAM